MKVEVVLALSHSQDIVLLRLAAAATAQDAVEASGLLHRLGDQPLLLGLFGRRIRPDRVLKEGDRVEILRPLAADPKEARRSRARRQEAGRGRAKR